MIFIPPNIQYYEENITLEKVVCVAFGLDLSLETFFRALIRAMFLSGYFLFGDIINTS
jgi:hypothetical protein